MSRKFSAEFDSACARGGENRYKAIMGTVAKLGKLETSTSRGYRVTVSGTTDLDPVAFYELLGEKNYSFSVLEATLDEEEEDELNEGLVAWIRSAITILSDYKDTLEIAGSKPAAAEIGVLISDRSVLQWVR